jgi:hypothetical protein
MPSIRPAELPMFNMSSPHPHASLFIEQLIYNFCLNLTPVLPVTISAFGYRLIPQHDPPYIPFSRTLRFTWHPIPHAFFKVLDVIALNIVCLHEHMSTPTRCELGFLLRIGEGGYFDDERLSIGPTLSIPSHLTQRITIQLTSLSTARCSHCDVASPLPDPICRVCW